MYTFTVTLMDEDTGVSVSYDASFTVNGVSVVSPGDQILSVGTPI